MRRNPDISFLCFFLLAAFPVIAIPDDEGSTRSKPDFEILEAKDGSIYRECYVTRVETDGLIIEHADGVARVSLFDLSSEIQAKYDFDPIAAMSAYKENLAAERERRKQLLLVTEKQKAEAERKAAEEELYQLAKIDWIPAEGTIVKKTSGGILVNLYRIVMLPTTEISTLGFEREGPPKRQLNKFSAGHVFLRHVGQGQTRGDKWQGYVEPVPYQQPLGPRTASGKHPVHRAVSKR